MELVKIKDKDKTEDKEFFIAIAEQIVHKREQNLGNNEKSRTMQ